MRAGYRLALVVVILLYATSCPARTFDFTIDPKTIPCGQYSNLQPIIWYGNDGRMTLERLAAFLTKVTDFWGMHFGVKNDGFFDIDRLRYVLEFGAGTW